MRTSQSIIAGSLCVLCFAGCAGGTPEPTEPKPPVVGAATPGEAPPPGGQVIAGAEPLSDVTPVPAPAEIVGTLRWKSPAATFAALAGYAKMPQGAVDGMARAAIQEMVQNELGSLVDAKAFAEAVSIEAPLDVVVAVDTKGTQPDIMMVTSVGLSSLRTAIGSVKGNAEPIGPGLWRIGNDDDWGPRCAIAAAAGRVPGRLVCGERYEHVQKLGPYVARTMAGLPEQPTDVSVELKFRGLAQKYGKLLANQARGLPMLAEQVKLGIPMFDKAIDEAAAALADEAGPLIDDQDSVKLELAVDARNGAVLTGKLQFAAQKSWTVGTLLDGADKAGPAPEIFWRLPKASETASWGVSGNPTRFDKTLRIGRALAEGGLEKLKFASAGDRAAIAKLLRLPFAKDVASSMATGHFGKSASAAPAAGGMLGQLFGSSVGWTVLGVDEAPAALRGYLDEAVKVYNRGGVQGAFKKEMGNDAKMLPSVKAVPAPKELGAGALDIEIKVANIEDPLAELNAAAAPAPGKTAAKPATTAITFHVLLMGEAKRTWIGIGMDRAALAKLMASLKGTAGGPDTLASHSAYDALRRGSHVSGGAMTLQTFISAVKPGLQTAAQLGGGGAELSQVMSMLEQLPYKGETPMVMVGDATLGGRPSTSFQLNVPRETLEDIGYLVRNLTAVFAK